MTAPIVWHLGREPLTADDLAWAETEPVLFDGDDTAIVVASNPGEEFQPGQLWARLSERDVALHGEPAEYVPNVARHRRGPTASAFRPEGNRRAVEAYLESWRNERQKRT